jgi:nitroreductase
MEKSSIILDALHQRRSIRKYTGEALTKDEIQAVLEAGRWAPSGLNNQPWRFLVIRTGDERQEAMAERTKYGHVVRRADTLIAVFLEKAAMYSPRKDYQGAGACIQNMLLAAHAQDLGAVWLGEIVNREEDVMQSIGVDPGQYELMAVIALGRPEQEGSSSRKPLEELMLEAL